MNMFLNFYCIFLSVAFISMSVSDVLNTNTPKIALLALRICFGALVLLLCAFLFDVFSRAIAINLIGITALIMMAVKKKNRAIKV